METLEGIKLFFTHSQYRWATLQLWKMKLCSLPGIRQVIAWRRAWVFTQKMSKMTPWERYLHMKKIEEQYKKFLFACALTRMAVCIQADGEHRDDEDFLLCKQELLSKEYINDGEMSEFKAWVEELTPDETDMTKIQEVMIRMSQQTE